MTIDYPLHSTFSFFNSSGFLSLTKSDAIKENIARLRCLPLFIEMSDEYPIVYDILWAVSFNKDIQRQLRSNSNFMSKLKHLANECDNQQIRKMTHGLLWNLEINHKDPPVTDIDQQNSFDMMISYSHKDKSLCRQIYDELIKTGYRVWIDFDQMHGNVMDAMAHAIEQSQTVIICISEDYRNSNYCRAEAQYAFQRQRKIVPVLLQKHYKPDGWLLFLIGQLLYVDFTKYEFPRAIEMLFKELKDSDTIHLNHIEIQPKPSTTGSLPKLNLSPILPPNIQDWTEVHVQSWLNSHHFVRLPELLSKCNGPSLVHLNEYIKNGDTNLILNLLQEESVEKTGQTLCLTELSRFQSLMNAQTPTFDPNLSIRTNQSNNTRTGEKGCCHCCLMM